MGAGGQMEKDAGGSACMARIGRATVAPERRNGMRLFGRRVPLVILDFDGVILDLFATFPQILETAASKLGLPTEPVRDYIQGHRNGTREGNQRFKAGIRTDLWPWLSDREVEQFYWTFRSIEKDIGYPLVPGSIEAIRMFRQAGAKVAICTMNDERAMAWKLRAAGITADLADSVVTRERAGSEKPNPRILKPIFQDTGFGPGDSVYVGDWYVDRELASRAGIEFLAVRSGAVPTHAFIRHGVPADRIFERLRDIALLAEP